MASEVDKGGIGRKKAAMPNSIIASRVPLCLSFVPRALPFLFVSAFLLSFVFPRGSLLAHSSEANPVKFAGAELISTGIRL